MIKKAIRVGLFVLAIVAVAIVFSVVRNCSRPEAPVQEGYKVPKQTYTPPIVKVPFITKDKQPISNKRLPIPKKLVQKSIAIKLPEGKTIDLIVDKKGDVYVPTDAPKDVQVITTIWNRPVLDFTLRSGYAAAWNGKHLFHCLSLDLVSLGKFSLGGEAGLADGPHFLAGLSAKYRFYSITNHLGLNALAGWDFVGKRAYTGVSISW